MARLSAAQESTLAFTVLAGWTTAFGVSLWRECSVATATLSLDALRRRGLVVHSTTGNRWRATKRGEEALAETVPV